MLTIYKYAIYLLIPLIKINLSIRIKKNKEEKLRIKERFGKSNKLRPKGNLIWIHAASVGEFNSATGLINILLKKNKILITTNTVTAYYYCKKIFGNKVIHQYAPIDHAPWVKKFIEHWSPKLVIWIESDLWPNTIRIISQKNIKSVLLNLRVSPKSFERWTISKQSFAKILNYFNEVFAQSKNDLQKIKNLTPRKIKYVGNLKLTSLPIKINKDNFLKIKKITASKKIILIASTHRNEENLILKSINKTLSLNKNLILLIIPRHPNRSLEVLKIVKKFIPESSLLSNYNSKFKSKCLIVNSLGEMSIYYKICEIVILGGSFINMGGHNPLEPAKLNCSILTGPSIYNWQNIYEEMFKNNACIVCKSEKELIKNFNIILKNNRLKKRLMKNALRYSKQNQSILKDILKTINPLLKGIKNA